MGVAFLVAGRVRVGASNSKSAGRMIPMTFKSTLFKVNRSHGVKAPLIIAIKATILPTFGVQVHVGGG